MPITNDIYIYNMNLGLKSETLIRRIIKTARLLPNLSGSRDGAETNVTKIRL